MWAKLRRDYAFQNRGGEEDLERAKGVKCAKKTADPATEEGVAWIVHRRGGSQPNSRSR